MLGLLAFLIEDRHAPIPQVFISSCVNVHVHFVRVTDATASALLNAKISLRGGLRQPWTVVKWCRCLLNLAQHQVDATSVIRQWNGMNASIKDAQLVGSKKQAIVNLIGLPVM